MDIKAEMEKLVKSITGDPAKIEEFKKDPIAAVKKYAGAVTPPEMIDQAVAAVKAKIGADKLSGVAGALGGLLNK
ncbi:MAG: hypothetical protein IJU16_07710 [Clostridia bacterium]|nr:hypothetical protein [Clostridia bacterium]